MFYESKDKKSPKDSVQLKINFLTMLSLRKCIKMHSLPWYEILIITKLFLSMMFQHIHYYSMNSTSYALHLSFCWDASLSTFEVGTPEKSRYLEQSLIN